VQGAALAGGHPIIAIDRFDNRLELARLLGATHLINTTHADVAAAIHRIVGSDGVDVAIDNTGSPEVIGLASRLTNARGRTVLVGVPPKDATAAIATLPLHFEKRLVGSHGGESRPDLDIPRYVRLIREGRLDLRALTGRTYPLEAVNDAIADMRNGSLAGRAIVQISTESNAISSMRQRHGAHA
jgi:S-(hydroxymethyl)glutathione dehydrogenase/alcohol dehydrogenase